MDAGIKVTAGQCAVHGIFHLGNPFPYRFMAGQIAVRNAKPEPRSCRRGQPALQASREDTQSPCCRGINNLTGSHPPIIGTMPIINSLTGQDIIADLLPVRFPAVAFLTQPLQSSKIFVIFNMPHCIISTLPLYALFSCTWDT